MKMNGMKVFATIVTLGVVVVAGLGAYMAGSPAKVRMEALDNRRVSDLQTISSAIDQYWRLEKKFPASLEELKKTRDVYVGSITDPETGTPYSYALGASNKYQLCAIFTLEMKAEDDPSRSYAYPVYQYGSEFWNHPAGYHCYALEVRPDPYAPIVK